MSGATISSIDYLNQTDDAQLHRIAEMVEKNLARLQTLQNENRILRNQRDEVLKLHKELLDNNNVLTSDGFRLLFNDGAIKEYEDELNGVVVDETN